MQLCAAHRCPFAVPATSPVETPFQSSRPSPNPFQSSPAHQIWNVSNPFDWMEMISLQGKTNFFEKRVS